MASKRGLVTNGCKKNNKKCPYCSLGNTKKNGKLGGIQRYKCTDCNKNFSSKKRPEKLQKIIFKDCFEHKQTLNSYSKMRLVKRL